MAFWKKKGDKKPAPSEVAAMKQIRAQMNKKHQRGKKEVKKMTNEKESRKRELSFPSDSKSSNSTQGGTKTLTLSFNPRKLLKGAMVVTILLVVFFAGRLTGDFSFGDDGTTELSAAATGDVELEEVVEEIEEKEEVVEEEAPPEEEVVEEEPEEEEEELEEEFIVTTYEDVTLQVTSMKTKDNYGEADVWGKMTSFDFTIKNEATGTVKADYFRMMVEGYGDDFMKEFPISYKDQSIPSGAYSSSAVIPEGFTYHRNTVGNLNKVRVSIILYDANARIIGSDSNEFDLSG